MSVEFEHDGNLSNEWDYKKDILADIEGSGSKALESFIKNQWENMPDWLKCLNFKDENLMIITAEKILPINQLKNQTIYGFYTIKDGQLKNLFVAESVRRQGIATKAIEYEKTKNDFLTVAVAKYNSSIKSLTQKLGFKPTGITTKGKFNLELEIYKWVK